MQKVSIRFKGSDKDKAQFFPTLRKRVNAYFQENNISKHANATMVVKTVVMLSMFLVPYFLIITETITNVWALWGLCVVMGFGSSGIGLSVMHDANHGAYSSNSWVNRILGWTLNMVGGLAFTWKVQHNVLHHSYTNVLEADEDIRGHKLLRFSPYSSLKPIHRFQHIYAFFLYGLMTLNWVIYTDFKRMVKYAKNDMARLVKSKIDREIVGLIVSKLFYFGYMVVLPLVLLDITWWQYLIGFGTMHWVSGFMLTMIFQMAHLIEETEHHPFPHETGTIENQWAIHQMETTANFATQNWLLNWYAGGLNFQVEHHLFPTICHVHYKKISKIVTETAKEFGVAYYEKKTIFKAIRSHFNLLKKLGHGEPVIMNHVH